MSYLSNITKDWKIVPFGKVVKRSQYGLSESGTETGTPYLKMSNIRDGKVVLDGADNLQVDEKTLEEYGLKEGDMVFNRTNSLDLVGKTGVFSGSEPAVFASYLIRFQLHADKADSRFVAYWFASAGGSHRLRSLATPGVSQSNINPTTLRLAMMVPRPPLAEQNKIGDILTTWHDALAAC
jgi:restriction endonuclease S subunit